MEELRLKITAVGMILIIVMTVAGGGQRGRRRSGYNHQPSARSEGGKRALPPDPPLTHDAALLYTITNTQRTTARDEKKTKG